MPQVPESEARDETADIYADIRATLGIPIVNLVWRHLATMGDALPWCWQVARPLYASGLCSAAAERIDVQVGLPAIGEITMDAARVDTDQAMTIRRILDTYHRANPLNLVALRTIELLLTAGQQTARRVMPRLRNDTPVVRGELPPILSTQNMSGGTAGLVAELDRLGAEPDGDFPPSVYRHLAHWPEFLILARDRLTPLDRTGALPAAMQDLKWVAERESVKLLPYVVAMKDSAATPTSALLAALQPFTEQAFPRLIVIVALLRRAFIAA